MLGANGESSLAGSVIAFLISPKICNLPSLACAKASLNTSLVTPFTLISLRFSKRPFSSRCATIFLAVPALRPATYLSSGEEAYWRYSLGAFLFEVHRSAYPASADFTQDLIANGFWDTLSKYSTNVVELEDDGMLVVPKRIYYVFDGWYDNPEFTGEKITSTDKDIEVYAKWIEETPVENITITNKVNAMDRFEEFVKELRAAK